MTDAAEHTHDWGDPVRFPPGYACVCRYPDCTEWAVRADRQRMWRKPTADELLSIVARMMEDIAYVDALTLVHRGDRAYAVRRVAEMRGYRDAGT